LSKKKKKKKKKKSEKIRDDSNHGSIAERVT